jgi:prevent-host-death family protein
MHEDRMTRNQKGVVKEVAASDLKNDWYAYLDEVSQARTEIVLTRYGKPIAKLVPFDGENESRPVFGSMKGTVTVVGDIIKPVADVWEAYE